MNSTAKIQMMTAFEARECITKINTGINNVRQLVLDLHDRDGWLAMGYENWTQCVKEEFRQAERYIFYQFKAAQIEQNVSDCTTVQFGNIPERQLRPLARLEPEKQKEAWQKAVETAPEGKVTAAHVYKIVKDMNEPHKEPVKSKLNQPVIHQEPISKSFQEAFDRMVIEIKNARAMHWKDTSHKGAIELMNVLLQITER